MKRPILVLLVTLVICALVAGPALAAPPVSNRWSGVEEYQLVSCGGDFNVRIRAELTYDDTMFFDNAGNPVRMGRHIYGEATFYNDTLGPASGVTGRTVINVEIYFVAGSPPTFQQTGHIFAVIVPHLGNVMMEVGRTTYVWTGTGEWGGLTLTSASGQHPWKLHEPMPELCTLLE